MSVSKREATNLIAEVQRVLWERWDPIGVNDMPEAFGEYDSYASVVVAKLLGGKGVEEIADYLAWVERVMMGLGSAPARDISAARALVELVEQGGK